MPLQDTIYCVQQIHIPPELPEILKQFTKAAIRAQPQDLLLWSAEYFNSLIKGESLPVKETLERRDTALTPALLKALHNKLSPGKTCSKETLQMEWQSLFLPARKLETLLSLGDFSSDVDWMQFLALSCSMLAGSILRALGVACEILTEGTEAGTARIALATATSLYTYLARVDGDISQEHIDAVLQTLETQAACQEGMVQPSDFIYLDEMSPPAAGDDAGTSSREG